MLFIEQPYFLEIEENNKNIYWLFAIQCKYV